MERTVLAYPVVSGKSTQAVTGIPEMFQGDPKGYWTARKELGITLERAFHQKTPQGEFVVAYLETTGPFSSTIKQLVNSSNSLNRQFIKDVLTVHGVDLTAPQTELPETVIDWVDSGITGTRSEATAFMIPLLPGKLEEGRQFARELTGIKGSELTKLNQKLNTTVQVVTVLHTPQGDISCVYLEGADPEASNNGFAAATDPFSVWYKAQLTNIYGIDFNTPLGQISNLIFDSEALKGSGEGVTTLQGSSERAGVPVGAGQTNQGSKAQS